MWKSFLINKLSTNWPIGLILHMCMALNSRWPLLKLGSLDQRSGSLCQGPGFFFWGEGIYLQTRALVATNYGECSLFRTKAHWMTFITSFIPTVFKLKRTKSLESIKCFLHNNAIIISIAIFKFMLISILNWFYR